MRTTIITITLLLSAGGLWQTTHAQQLQTQWDTDLDDSLLTPLNPEDINLTNLIIYRYRQPEITGGDTLWTYLLPELPVYPPLHFHSAAQQRAYNRLVANVKKVLPYAKMASLMLRETYQVLETLPDKKSRDQHISRVEHDIKQQYTPVMKKLTLSQGKLLIKLIDRECNQDAYQLIRAFVGPARAAFYQVFAWTFNASLKKQYDPTGDDRLIERVVRQIEAGQL